jgi:acetyl esterase/lipase
MKSTIVYKKEHKFEILGDFYPVLQKSSPVIVYIHGGGLVWGSREDIKKQQVELYHSAGFNVFSIDYRLAPETKLPDIVEDINSALQWLESEAAKAFQFDSKKIAVIGSSAGAYLALMSGIFKNKPQAIVSFYGYGDITGNWALQPSPYYQAMTRVPKELAKMLVSNQIISSGPIEKRYALYMYGRQQGEWIKDITGIHPEGNREQLLHFCPLYHVNNEFPPTLFLHGTMDEDVPYEQSVLMNKTLNQAGSVSKLITIPNGKHVFDENWKSPVVQQVFDEVITFLHENLK